VAEGEDEVADAIEVFVRGFCVGKSLTHPYEHEKIGNVWVMRDAPRRNPRDYRNEEWVAYCAEPCEVDSLARRKTRGRFFICAIQRSDEPLEVTVHVLAGKSWSFQKS
jgi:hypothetical protein